VALGTHACATRGPALTATPSQLPRPLPAIRAFTLDSKRAATLPFLSTRNLVKFHWISPPVEGFACLSVRNWYRGAWSLPFTEIFEYMGNVTLYLVLQKVLISSLVPGSWPAEIVGWEPQNHESPVLVLFVKRLQPGVLRRESAPAGHVDNQDNLSLVRRKGGGAAINRVQGELMHVGCSKEGCRHNYTCEKDFVSYIRVMRNSTQRIQGPTGLGTHSSDPSASRTVPQDRNRVGKKVELFY